MQIPTWPARSKGELLRRSPERILDQSSRKAHDLRALIHLRAGILENPAAPGGVHPHTGLSQDPERTLVHLGTLVFRKYL
jgi:hypothetical protein